MDPHWVTLRLRANLQEHPYLPAYSDLGTSVYPGVSEEGWIAFEVPSGIELDETTLKIRGLVWNLEEEKVEKIAPIPLIR